MILLTFSEVDGVGHANRPTPVMNDDVMSSQAEAGEKKKTTGREILG